MPLIDPVGSISRLAQEGTREVPYPLFMNCFNKLLKDPRTLEPHPPSEDLKEYFRAVCIAIDLSIADSLGRSEDRKKEFYEHVYPVWKQTLPEDEFQRYQEILDGSARERLMLEREQKQRLEAQEAERRRKQAEKRREEDSAERAGGPKRPRFAELTRAALEAEEALEGAPRPTSRRRTSQGPARRPTEALDELAPVPVLESVDELVDAIAEGELAVGYSGRSSRRPFARYRFRDENVTVQLVKTSHSYYMLLSYPRGFSEMPGAAEIVNSVVTGMDYRQAGPFTYEKQQGELMFKIGVGAHSTNLVEKRLFPFTPTSLGRAMAQMHENLLTVIGRLERELRRRG